MYAVKIEYASKELNPTEKMAYTDVATASKLDKLVTEENPFFIEGVKCFVILSIHNDDAKNTEYRKAVIVGAEDTYTTSSETVIKRLIELDERCKDNDSEIKKLKIFKQRSKNFDGCYMSVGFVL